MRVLCMLLISPLFLLLALCSCYSGLVSFEVMVLFTLNCDVFICKVAMAGSYLKDICPVLLEKYICPVKGARVIN
jgi:hypothetical protein